jgi:hypothetical protein
MKIYKKTNKWFIEINNIILEYWYFNKKLRLLRNLTKEDFKHFKFNLSNGKEMIMFIFGVG